MTGRRKGRSKQLLDKREDTGKWVKEGLGCTLWRTGFGRA